MTRITGDYIDAILTALRLHRPCAETEGLLAQVDELFMALQNKKIRQPNDWQPEYTGGFTVRWYDGDGSRLGHSSKSCQITIGKSDAGFVYTIRGRLRKFSQGEQCDLTLGEFCDAVDVLVVMIKSVDRKEQ